MIPVVSMTFSEQQMYRLGVVACQVLELEFAHVLSNDEDVDEIWVVNDEFSELLIQTLEKAALKPIHRILDVDQFNADASQGVNVLVRVMEVGLHSNILNLRNEVKKAVWEISSFVDAIFLGYGLCGNALKNADDLFNDIPVPVSLTMEKEDPVDDCVGLIIGGRENYYAEQCRCAGTMFMNAGFSRHLGTALLSDIPEKLRCKKEKIMQRLMGSYERSLLLPTPVMGETELRDNTEAFNETYGLRVETRRGTLELLENGWKTAKGNAGYLVRRTK